MGNVGNADARRARCLHCDVLLVNERPWPGLGTLADCPSCHSSRLLRSHLDPEEREEIVIATQAVAFMNGTLGDPERWIRAWCVVSAAYLREGDKASAARCLDDSITTFRVQQRALEAREQAQAVAS